MSRPERSLMALDERTGRVGPVVSAAARPAPRARYLPIAEHGLIGDLYTVALVGTDGTINWYRCPRFASPSVFAAILDADHGCSASRPTATAGAPSSSTSPAPTSPSGHGLRR